MQGGREVTNLPPLDFMGLVEILKTYILTWLCSEESGRISKAVVENLRTSRST